VTLKGDAAGLSKTLCDETVVNCRQHRAGANHGPYRRVSGRAAARGGRPTEAAGIRSARPNLAGTATLVRGCSPRWRLRTSAGINQQRDIRRRKGARRRLPPLARPTITFCRSNAPDAASVPVAKCTQSPDLIRGGSSAYQQANRTGSAASSRSSSRHRPNFTGLPGFKVDRWLLYFTGG
jgi:hypothetical protein